MRLLPFKTNRVFALPVNLLKPSWNRAKNLKRFRKSEFQMFGNFKSFDEERFSPSNSYYANANSLEISICQFIFMHKYCLFELESTPAATCTETV